MSDEALVERVARLIHHMSVPRGKRYDACGRCRAQAVAVLSEVADAVEGCPEDGVRSDGLPATKDDVADWLREQAAEEGA